jgi:hypothetical protein
MTTYLPLEKLTMAQLVSVHNQLEIAECHVATLPSKEDALDAIELLLAGFAAEYAVAEDGSVTVEMPE